MHRHRLLYWTFMITPVFAIQCKMMVKDLKKLPALMHLIKWWEQLLQAKQLQYLPQL